MILDNRGNTDILVNRQEHEILTSTFHPGVAEMTTEEQEARAQEELSTGPFRFCKEWHKDPDKLHEQQEAAGQTESIQQALQHGVGGSHVDRTTQKGKK